MGQGPPGTARRAARSGMLASAKEDAVVPLTIAETSSERIALVRIEVQDPANRMDAAGQHLDLLVCFV